MAVVVALVAVALVPVVLAGVLFTAVCSSGDGVDMSRTTYERLRADEQKKHKKKKPAVSGWRSY